MVLKCVPSNMTSSNDQLSASAGFHVVGVITNKSVPVFVINCIRVHKHRFKCSSGYEVRTFERGRLLKPWLSRCNSLSSFRISHDGIKQTDQKFDTFEIMLCNRMHVLFVSAMMKVTW